MQLRVFLVLTAAILSSPLVVADTTVTIAMTSNWGTWDGWGTSLAWSGKRFGNRNDLADILFTRNDTQLNGQTLPGMGLNIARYNAGACSWNKLSWDNDATMVESPNIDHSWQMEGYWLDGISGDPATVSWNWSVDANQRAMLQKAKARGADRFELFSNSPMWWMCSNHNPSGSNCIQPISGCNDENLDPKYQTQHAVYLATIAKYARDNWGLTFESVEPFNEPSSHGWIGYMGPFEAWLAEKLGYGNWGRQEGCHINWDTMPNVIEALRSELDNRGLHGTLVAASDEYSYSESVDTWKHLNDSGIKVQRWNVHGYQDGPRDVLRDLVHGQGQKLWMSEYGDGDVTGKTLANQLLLDLRWLRPTAWVYWLVLDGGNWGLIDAPTATGVVGAVSQKYFVLTQFTRHIRPGMRILDSGAKNVVAAYDDAKQLLVVVVVNLGDAQNFQFDMPLFAKPPTNARPIRRWVTKIGSGGERYEFSNLTWNSPGTAFEVSVDANMVHTFEFDDLVASDHYPILANATWASGGELQQSDFYGGYNPRSPVSDVPALAAKSSRPKPVKLSFHGGDRVDSVGLTLADGAVVKHGGGGGTEASMTLGSSEYWTSAELCQANRGGGIDYGIVYIKAITSNGGTLEAGHRSSECRIFNAPSGWQIIGFVAWEGWEIDGLSFVYGPQQVSRSTG
ncbi:endo-beta-1,6-galactanase [Pochonia chlamydosporia 170]|uniref:Endo-beta-1,6-galactanase n=1 Tax=Pochonia chlamydosporia 170 TaxID=1380566 RepID=A0A179F655_METCM|nr:endo-beta-1,6-galactanase [Pochonia chlamydosporia 170]OAQ60917.1 endo-beta-1,6-galactanase [Pochonia chlamydosporia 170]